MSDDNIALWSEKTPGARAINRAALILRALAVHGETGCSLAIIAERAKLPKATVHRILSALIAEHYVERRPFTRDYRIGSEIFSLAVSAGRHLDIRELARPVLQHLRQETRRNVFLAVRSGYDALCIDRLLTSDPGTTPIEVGGRVPLGASAAGIAILAFLKDNDIAEIVKSNRERLAFAEELDAEHIYKSIRGARATGRAVTTFSGFSMCGIGVPVLDHRNAPLASLTITQRAQPAADFSEVTDILQVAARKLAMTIESEAFVEPRVRDPRDIWREMTGKPEESELG